jgi:hypothetical protein
MSRLSINLSEVSVVKFKLNPLCWALAACLCISQSGVALATENVPSSQAATDAGLVFGIQQVVLVGNPGVLSRKTQERLLAVLAPAHGAQSGLQRLQVAVQQGQQCNDKALRTAANRSTGECSMTAAPPSLRSSHRCRSHIAR